MAGKVIIIVMKNSCLLRLRFFTSHFTSVMIFTFVLNRKLSYLAVVTLLMFFHRIE